MVFSIARLLWECWFRGNVFFARNGEVGHLVLPGLLSAENAALEKYEPLCLCQPSGNTTNFLKKYFCTPPEIHLISYFVKQNQAAFSFSLFNWPLFQSPILSWNRLSYQRAGAVKAKYKTFQLLQKFSARIDLIESWSETSRNARSFLKVTALWDKDKDKKVTNTRFYGGRGRGTQIC